MDRLLSSSIGGDKSLTVGGIDICEQTIGTQNTQNLGIYTRHVVENPRYVAGDDQVEGLIVKRQLMGICVQKLDAIAYVSSYRIFACLSKHLVGIVDACYERPNICEKNAYHS